MYGKELGEMAWMDLSVPDATNVSKFYQAVLGWEIDPVKMTQGDEAYEDFVMTSVKPESVKCSTNHDSDDIESKEAEALTNRLMTGICHARGDNEDMPAMWLPYFLVKNIDESIMKVTENGGSLFTKIKNVGADRYVVLKDPAGAMAAIYQKNEKS